MPSLECLSVKTSPVRATSTGSGRMLMVSRGELKALARSWRTVGDDKHQLGVDILLQVFKEKPDLIPLFFGLDDVSDNEVLQAHPKFIKHADTFTMFLHISVARLVAEDGEELVRLTHKVGRAHASIHRVTFDAEYWMLFKKAVIDQMEPYCRKARINRKLGRDVWNRFVMFLIMEMKHSFNIQTIRRLSCPDLSVLYGAILDNYQDCEMPEEYQKLRTLSLSDKPGLMTISAQCVMMTEPLHRKNPTGSDEKCCTDRAVLCRGSSHLLSSTAEMDGVDFGSASDLFKTSCPPSVVASALEMNGNACKGASGDCRMVKSDDGSKPESKPRRTRSLLKWFRPNNRSVHKQT